MMARKKKSVESSGKRKTAIARASVKAGKGRIRVNSEPIEILQPALARRKAMEPLIIADAMNRLSKVDINLTTTGGGIMELRDEYLRFDRSLLVNDPRRKEPKHQLGRGARRKKQKSYR